LCGGGSTDVYENYSPRSYEDYEYELANNSREPAEERYVNVYEPGEPRNWVPEDSISTEELINTSTGTYEVTRYPGLEPTEEDVEEAWELYNESFEAAKQNKWFNFSEADEDGYSIEGGSNHWVNTQNISIYTDGTLNPQNPENLVYYQDPNNSDNKILAGYMYRMPVGSYEPGEQIAGPLMVWHYHPMVTGRVPSHINEYVLESNRFDTIEEAYDSLGLKNNYSERKRTGEMVHVWFVRHPEGPFGTSMSVPKEYLEKPEKMSKDRFVESIVGAWNESESTGAKKVDSGNQR
jgi:hypothetical protein